MQNELNCLAYLQQTEADAQEDASEPELVGELANAGSGAWLQVVELDSVGLHTI